MIMNQEATGALSGLRPLQLSDLQLYKNALTQVDRICWHQYFPYLHFRYDDLLISEINGSICIFYKQPRTGRNPKLNLYFLPMPMQESVLKLCLERVREFNSSKRAEIYRVDEQDIEKLEYLKADIKTFSLEKEYVYNPKNYRSLSGAQFQKLRQDINRMKALDDVTVRDFEKGDKQDCLTLMEEWAVIQQGKYEGRVTPRGFARRCVRNSTLFDNKDLFGLVVLIDGKIRSVGFAGEIRPGLANLFITYSDHNYSGLNRFLFYHMILRLDDYALANYAGASTPGLEFAKESLRPVFKHNTYRVHVK